MARRLALIIGNSVYRDSTLARLTTPDVDVGALAEILLDPELGAFEDANVLINMTSATVRRAISDFFAKKTREDLLLLYFSGHGVLDESGRLHLAVKDTDHNLLRGTAISASFITDEMDNSRSQRQVLVLDCCHSGAFARGAKGAPGITVGTGSAFEGTGFGRVVLTATDATQYAWEGERIIGEAESSLFTHYMVQGLQSGAADINQDGQVTVDELYDYVYGEVVRQTPKQTPGKWSYKEQGEIVIARATQRQQPLPVVEKKQGQHLDEELEQRLEHLYTRGLSAYWLEDWVRAARSFQEIAEIQPDYRDTATKLAEARRQLDLKESYEKALTALQAGEFQGAVSALEAVVAAVPDYKDAAVQLEAARKQRQMADLYAQARQLNQAGQWQATLNVLERMAALDPAYADPEELLSTAQREFGVQKRRADIERQYRQALQAMNAGQWQQARQLFAQIREAEPGFEDVERLLARAEAEIAQREALRRTQEQVGVLYERALSLSRARQWRQALEKIHQIQALDPQFPDPEGIAAKASNEIQKEDEEAKRQDELAALYSDAVKHVYAGQYQEALEKWSEIQAIDPNYPDRKKIQGTAKRKLKELTLPPHVGLWRSISLPWKIAMGVLSVVILSAIVYGIWNASAIPSTTSKWATLTSMASVASTMSDTSVSSITPTIEPVEAGTSVPALAEEEHAFVIAQEFIYDDFNNSIYDGQYNSSIWKSNGDCRNVQRGGELQIQDANCELRATQPETVQGADLRLFGANMQLSSDHNGNPITSYLTLEAILSDGFGVWEARCDQQADVNGVRFLFEIKRYGSQAGEKTLYLIERPGRYDRWYTVQLVVNPATMTVTCLLDGEALGTYVPENVSALRAADFTRTLVNIRDASAFATVHIDDIHFIPPAHELATSTPVAGCVPPPSGIVSWWTGDGNAIDIIGRYDGVLENGAVYGDGKVGQAFTFPIPRLDGKDGFVATGEIQDLNDLQELTIETWVKLVDIPSSRIQRFVTILSSGAGKATLRHDGSNSENNLHFYMGIDNDTEHIWAPNVLQTGIFHHVAGTYDGSDMRSYLDGEEVGNLAVRGAVVSGSSSVYLSWSEEPLYGWLDEVSIYNRALSPEEIQAIYQAGSAGKCKP